jgi:hypothetical protein
MAVTETSYVNQRGELLYVNRGVSIARPIRAGEAT